MWRAGFGPVVGQPKFWSQFNPLRVQFKSLLHGQEGCVFFSVGNKIYVRMFPYVSVRLARQATFKFSTFWYVRAGKVLSSLWLMFHQIWDNTHNLHQTVCRLNLGTLNIWTLMPILKQTVFRMMSKFCHKGRGIGTRGRYRHRAIFQDGQSHNLFFEAPPPVLWLMTTVPNNCCQKSLSLYIQRTWKRMYQKINVQITNLLQILSHVLLPKLTKHTLFGLNSGIKFIFLLSQFCHPIHNQTPY
jgi:hypothetical protein